MPLFLSHNVTHENVVFWPFAVKNRDRGGGGAGRAITTFIAGIYFLGLQLTWKKFPWNYWTLPYGRVGCLYVPVLLASVHSHLHGV